MKESDFQKDLLDFLHKSPTPFHATHSLANRLRKSGFIELHEFDKWDINPGRYFVTRNQSSLIAFQLATRSIGKAGIRMVGAHTDSPGLKLKPLPEAHNKGLFQLGVEVYGGALLNPWFDRDLSLAGRITKGTKNGNVENHLIDFQEPVAFIPSLAIHLDRGANKNRSINPESDVVPIIAGEEHFKTLEDFLSKHKKTGEKILSADLFFYDTNKAKIIGAKKEFLVGARLDNQLSCYAAVAGLLEANKSENCMVVLNDHEEVGSTSAAGADGSFLSDVLNRITIDPETKLRGLARSLLISTDNAHGVHPNFSEKHEKNHGPILNKGPAIKHNANQRYATNSETAGFFKKLCLDKNIPVQEFVNRGDMACGSTIGPITASKIGVRTLDVGISTFGMHSIRELAGIKDVFYLSAILHQFFNESKDLGANP